MVNVFTSCKTTYLNTKALQQAITESQIESVTYAWDIDLLLTNNLCNCEVYGHKVHVHVCVCDMYKKKLITYSEASNPI